MKFYKIKSVFLPYLDFQEDQELYFIVFCKRSMQDETNK